MIYFDEAMRVLLANKIRTLLTITGLIIGVGAVIAIQVLGNGMSGAVQGILGGLADNSFSIIPNGQQGDFRKAQVRLRDIVAIKNTVPNISEALPLAITRQVVHAGHGHSPATVATASQQRWAKAEFAYGRNFTADEVAQRGAVCLLSDKIYQRLFPKGGDPTGTSIHVADKRYIIVGVMSPPKAGVLNIQLGGDVSLPYTTYMRDLLQGHPLNGASFYVSDIPTMPQTEVAVVREMKRLHKNAAGIQYFTFDKKTFNQAIGGIFGALTFVVSLIGAVSLLVAGIGIMNIMLVSVTERTREIGIRKAIGARQGQILMQFFIEALVLCGLGCGIGLIIGLGIGFAVDQLAIVKLTGTAPNVPWIQATLIAVIFASVVTIAFGLYPAFRAARLDPIEALRYE
ncbi:MAG: ABC transporter permease [Candidatus Eremiobacteraeota bacterium]|nr:ABC transporter permease [Candidatus Eremiobacteraeota bacterium]